jgi:hypothetical protein
MAKRNGKKKKSLDDFFPDPEERNPKSRQFFFFLLEVRKGRNAVLYEVFTLQVQYSKLTRMFKAVGVG